MDTQLAVFLLDAQRYALSLDRVDRVVRAVAVSPLPHAPDIVMGLINVQGRPIPVINVRRRFRLPERRIALTDRIVIAHTDQRPVGLVVDAVADVTAYPAHSMIEAGDILPGLEYVEGVVKLPDGLAYIHDLDRFLSLEEETALAQAMESA